MVVLGRVALSALKTTDGMDASRDYKRVDKGVEDVETEADTASHSGGGEVGVRTFGARAEQASEPARACVCGVRFSGNRPAMCVCVCVLR